MATVDPAVVVYQIFNDVFTCMTSHNGLDCLQSLFFPMVREREETGVRVFDETHSLSV